MASRKLLSKNMDFSLFTTITEKPGVTGSYQQHYAGLLNLFEIADLLGFEAAFVAEHHLAGNAQAGYPLIPNPAIFLAAAAMRTKHLKLGPGVSVIPFHNPLSIVEDYAMLDQLSEGRLVMGVGAGDSGLNYEMEGFCISAEERIPKYVEGLKIIEAAWNGATITHQGNFFQYDKASLNIALYQRPGPPIHIAISRPEAAYAVARHGYPILSTPYAGVGNIIEHYKRGCRDGGLPYSPDMHFFMFNTFVGESKQVIRRKYSEATLSAGNNVDWGKFDSMISDGNWLVGDPDFLAHRLVELHTLGLRKLILAIDFVVGMEISEVLAALDLFAHEVVPKFEEIVQGNIEETKSNEAKISVGF